MRFTLKGTAEMERKLHRIAKEAPDEFLLAGIDEMNVEKQEMQRRTPVDSGLLRDSLTVRLDRLGAVVMHLSGAGTYTIPAAYA